MPLTFAEKIKIIMGRRSMSFVDLAVKMGTTRQNVSNKMRRGNFSEDAMKKIADLLDCDYEGPTLKMRDSGEEI
ncbi:MAG: helix-turn-helix domain-containing protein [Spirochaetaceae bacterium]|nr:helix-turn-helix domain-containing protein [Spirochaetaceae bacterium]